jgi:hypothetical protein
MQIEVINAGGFADRDLRGIDLWVSWTPTRTGWTDVGTPTVTARFRVVGRQCFFQIRIVPETTCATTAGTSYVSLPVQSKGLGGDGSMQNQTTNVAIGVCSFDVTNSRVYVPTQVATGNTFSINGWYEI